MNPRLLAVLGLVAVPLIVVGFVVNVAVGMVREERACHDKGGVLYNGQCIRAEVIE